jgi:hypothetical protein
MVETWGRYPYFRENRLTGVSSVVGSEPYQVVVATNGYVPEAAASTDARCCAAVREAEQGLAVLAIERPENGTVDWVAAFRKKP